MPPPPDADEESPISAAPETVDWDRASRKLAAASPSLPTVSITYPNAQATDPRLDPVADEAELEALTRDLMAMGALDSRADRGVDRAVAHRTTLARARALRFRLALLQSWPASAAAPADPSGQARPLHFDLAIDSMLLVALADGAPAIFGPTSPLPVVAVMVETLRALRPELPRTALRDRGSAAIARLTIVGWKGALEALAKSAAATPVDSRKLALELAARAALTPAIDEHRLGALQDLERVMSLPTGSVAPAIEAARRSMAARLGSPRPR